MESRFFVRDYIWTGSGAEREKPPEVVSEVDKWGMLKQRMHGPLLVEGNSRTMVVDLGRTLSVSEEEDICFRHQMKDLAGTFLPRLRIKPSTGSLEHLNLRVTLPNWEGLQCFYRMIAWETQEIIESETMSIEQDNAATISFYKQIANPSVSNIGHMLEWTHDDL